MTLKSDGKFKEKLTCHFKYYIRNLVNFYPTIQKSENFTSMSYSCPKYMRFELKKIQRSYLSWHWTWCKILKTLILWFQKWHEELGELSSLEHPKVWKLYIDGLFLSKAYTVSARNFQRNYVSWHWRVLQTLNENCLVGWKMTLGIWLIFMRAVESLKSCTLIGSICPKHTNI